MAAARLSWLARNRRSPGEESRAGAIVAQAIEVQPSFGQIKPSRRLGRRSGSSRRKTWRISTETHKRLGLSGEEKEMRSCRSAAVTAHPEERARFNEVRVTYASEQHIFCARAADIATAAAIGFNWEIVRDILALSKLLVRFQSP